MTGPALSVEAFPNDDLHSPLLLMVTPLAIHANVVLNSPAPHCQQIPSPYVSSYFKAERSLGDVNSLAHSAALRAEATRGLAPKCQCYLGECPAHFRGKVILLDFDHNLILAGEGRCWITPSSQI
jgi:hypothetical protein